MTTTVLSRPIHPAPADVQAAELRRYGWCLVGAYVLVAGLSVAAATAGVWDVARPLLGAAIVLLLASFAAAYRAVSAGQGGA